MADHHEDTCREASYSFDEGSMTKGPKWERATIGFWLRVFGGAGMCLSQHKKSSIYGKKFDFYQKFIPAQERTSKEENLALL